MKKKFFLNKTVEALSEKQVTDLNSIFGGAVRTDDSGAVGVPNDDIIYYPTGGGGPRCPHGYYWNSHLGRCLRDGEVSHDVAVDHAPANM